MDQRIEAKEFLGGLCGFCVSFPEEGHTTKGCSCKKDFKVTNLSNACILWTVNTRLISYWIDKEIKAKDTNAMNNLAKELSKPRQEPILTTPKKKLIKKIEQLTLF